LIPRSALRYRYIWSAPGPFRSTVEGIIECLSIPCDVVSS
jgi:hypothetical protein